MSITIAESWTIVKDFFQIAFFIATPTIAWTGLRGWQKQKEFEVLLEAVIRLKELYEAIKQCRNSTIYINNSDVAKADNLNPSDHLNLIYNEIIQRFNHVEGASVNFKRAFIKSELFISGERYNKVKEAVQYLENLCHHLKTSIQYYFSQGSIGISNSNFELEKHHAIVFQLEKYSRIHINSDFEEIDYEDFQKKLDACVEKIENLLRSSSKALSHGKRNCNINRF